MRLEHRAFETALAGVIPPELARLTTSTGSGEPVATADLLDATMLARVLGPEPLDQRAMVSVWVLEAFEAVLPTVVAAAVLLGRVPSGKMSWLIGDRAITGLRAEAWDEGNFAAFTRQVLAPMVSLMADRGGVSTRVLWSNAGHITEAFLGMLERDAGVSTGSVAIRQLLAERMVDGAPNRLFAPVRYVGERRIRRVCCLRFLVPSWRICLICPLPEGHASRRRG